MSSFSRRHFIATLAAIPFAEWFGNTVGQQIRTRCDISSANGQVMLKKYAKAVATMKNSVDGDPLSWTFQWYTHAVKSDATKPSEIQRIYPTTGAAHRDLANEMWNTCQAHFDSVNEDFFLPWHRMYVYFLERIIQKIVGDDSFALPYWNYSTSGTAHGVLPQPFRMQDDSTFGPLYVANRNASTPQDPTTPNVNNGDPIDKLDPGALDLTALQECTYQSHGAAAGFNQALDGILHGNVHVEIGNRENNMGSVFWAARDPIFWMHHCNIDRLWASWNKAGRKNPTHSAFLDQQFVFANENGSRIASKVKDFMETSALGYDYDHFEPIITPCVTPELGLGPLTVNTLAVKTSNTKLTNTPVQVKLSSAAPGLVPLTAQTISAGQRFYLTMRNLQTNVEPGILYHVYFELPGKSPDPMSQYRVGSINFFGATAHKTNGGNSAPVSRFYSFDVTKLIADLSTKGPLKSEPTVTIASSRPANSEAKPIIGEIALVQQ